MASPSTAINAPSTQIITIQGVPPFTVDAPRGIITVYGAGGVKSIPISAIIQKLQNLKNAPTPNMVEMRMWSAIAAAYGRAKQASETQAQSAAQNSMTVPSSSPSPPLIPAHQLSRLRAQVSAYQTLSQGGSLSGELQNAIGSEVSSLSLSATNSMGLGVNGVNGVGVNGTGEQNEWSELKKVLEADHRKIAEGALGRNLPLQATQGQASNAITTNGAVGQQIRPSSSKSPEKALEKDTMELEMTPIFPYNHYMDPYTRLKERPDDLDFSFSGLSTRPVVPSLLPPGLDPHTLIEAENALAAEKIAIRLRELGEISSNIPRTEVYEELKMKLLVEQKALALLNVQRTLRNLVLRSYAPSATVSLVADRNAFRRYKKTTIRDSRALEGVEKKQRVERTARSKAAQSSQLSTVSTQRVNLLQAHSNRRTRAAKLGRAVLKFHVEAEKEEAKRLERLSKERLKALKNDDEEAYLRLIDSAKDTRLTHLIKQTDAYLEGLAQSVMKKQAAAGQIVTGPIVGEAVDEGSFGARAVFEEEEKGKLDYYNVAHRIKEVVTKQSSLLVGGQLKEYQIKGLQWMISLFNNNLNGILADEMGLGKTIQTISLITYIIEHKRVSGPFLVIAPLSTISNWQAEFEKWAPAVSFVIYKGTPATRKKLQSDMRYNSFQVCLTTYEFIVKDRPVLSKYHWVHLIIDEGHRMKNTQSKLSLTLNQYYRSKHRLILTGTPLQNNLPELWALLNFVLPEVFNSVKSFDEWFNTPFANTGGQDKIELNEEEALLVIKRLHKVLRPFLLRRLKKDVESELPDKVEKIIRCKMSPLQLRLTKQIKDYGMIYTESGEAVDDGSGKGGSKGIKGLQNILMQLRKICNHPYVFPEVENALRANWSGNPFEDPNIWRVAGKFELLDRILPKLFLSGHRVLMFFQMTQIMDIMEDYLNYRKMKFLRLDGSTKPDERAGLLQQFNAPDSDIPIFLLSTRAGGLGLNLQTADTVIIYDSDWNPHQDLQAQDRAHRIGQKKEVRILRLVTEKSVEEQVLASARKKQDLDKKVIQGGRFDNKTSVAEREEYLRQIMAQIEEEEDPDSELTDAELNDILARGDDELRLFNELDRKRFASEKKDRERSGKKPQTRLIEESELPRVWRADYVPPKEEAKDDTGPRKRKAVHYDDGLTEEQFINALEDDSVDITELVDSKRKRRERRAAKKEEIMIDDEGTPEPVGKKRKRGKLMSVTPSLDGDADEPKVKRRKVGGTGKSTGGGSEEVDIRKKMKEIFSQCYDAVEAVDNPEYGHQASGLFLRLPSKTEYPHYYTIIKQPISMAQIKKRSQSSHYKTMEEYKNDWLLMFQNARTFNDDSSIVYHDAGLLERTFLTKFNELTRGSGLPGTSTIGNASREASSAVQYDDE